MKILTLNTHSLIEEDYERKLEGFVDFLIRERPDAVALQEVNQPCCAPEAKDMALDGMIPAEGAEAPLRQGNHAARVALMLHKAGIACRWTWLPVKLGYGMYDEGLAVLALSGEIAEPRAIPLSSTQDFADWKRRMALSVRLTGQGERLFCVHMGWWSDESEPFRNQWDKLTDAVRREGGSGSVWLAGDFNNPAELRGEGYDLMIGSGWHDAYQMAENRHGNATVPGEIDGWRRRTDAECGLRMDYILCSGRRSVRSCAVVLDGRRGMKVSDHFGVMIETGENDHNRE